MKWGPQPKPSCVRPDCDKQARQWGCCPNHAALLDRNGSPYTREEIAEMHAANRHSQEMDAAIAVNPPEIVWQLDPVRKVQVAIYISDPHADSGVHYNARKTHCKRGHPFDEENTRVEPDGARECRTCKNEKRRVPRPECTDENLLAAGQMEL